MFGLSELAIILITVVTVLAARKLPDLARSAGKSARILKAEATPRVIKGETGTPGPITAPAGVPRPRTATPPDTEESRPQG